MAESSRGTKRTAEEAFSPPRRIRALDVDVVNKIAAGEIIVAPVHALKELIENAVDAGSTALEVLVKDGGLKLLQITDNGSGINRDDLPILCERFTTSKLKTFEDLSSIGTYGFRGEALASISHIAHLTVTTKTRESSCAYKAQYSAGRLAPAKPGQSADPKPCAGRQGTQIQVEDLFYNVPSRKRAFRSSSEEYAKILDMVGRYSVHCKDVAFSCRKHGESGASLSIPAQASVIDRIRLVHNSAIANDLISYAVENRNFGFSADGWASSVNYSGKKTTLLLFINHRSVESTAIRKAIESTYQAFLPRHGHPFVYLNLDIDPARVDVNVHPTKREVNFLNEEEIIEVICDEIRTSLGKVDTSRTFMAQSLLSSNKPAQTVDMDDANPTPTPSRSAPTSTKTPLNQSQGKTAKTYENMLVRTDSRARKITSMLPPAKPSSPSLQNIEDEVQYTTTSREHTLCRLTSIKTLRAAVRESIHNELTTAISQHTFVGIVDMNKRIAAVQSGIKLLLIDFGMMCAEYFYQLGLADFGNFGSIKLDPPLSLQQLLEIGAEQEAASMTGEEHERYASFDWNGAVTKVHDQLVGRREMLSEYFSLEISEDGMLESLPLMVKGYTPPMSKLACFLLRLGPRVNWTEEQGCFETFLRELAAWYVPETFTENNAKDGTGYEDEEMTETGAEEKVRRKAHVQRALEHVLFPAFRSRLIATREMRKGVVEVADLKGLYRVFERC
ncbi:DNA mismatch repair protein MutL [Myriangium duriaei CBS 260.36]|uniref:DNA mismatch repair protein MutL n=1 Tax=Myriangium duriaei CBS 260.36 TaxID=1168546 RepID=A0A9P4MDK7_9PEZI|nr:DNA mismatch repair protein MutL [Myriangium duriaei CBS 260.36]